MYVNEPTRAMNQNPTRTRLLLLGVALNSLLARLLFLGALLCLCRDIDDFLVAVGTAGQTGPVAKHRRAAGRAYSKRRGRQSVVAPAVARVRPRVSHPDYH